MGFFNREERKSWCGCTGGATTYNILSHDSYVVTKKDGLYHRWTCTAQDKYKEVKMTKVE